MRRNPEAVLTTHIFDPKRRELYVEGTRDVKFFSWLTTPNRDKDAVIVPIDLVDVQLDESGGGNRQRLVNFLRIVAGSPASILGFVDRDQDDLLGIIDHPENAVLTDYRDLESYVLWEENVARVLMLGCGIDKVSPKDFLDSAINAATFTAACRLVSTQQSLELSISEADWPRKIAAKGGLVSSLNRKAILTALLQRAKISLQILDQLEKDIESAEDSMRALEPQRYIHGKDMMRIMEKQLKSLGVIQPDVFSLFGPTFTRTLDEKQVNLKIAAQFVSTS